MDKGMFYVDAGMHKTPISDAKISCFSLVPTFATRQTPSPIPNMSSSNNEDGTVRCGRAVFIIDSRDIYLVTLELAPISGRPNHLRGTLTAQLGTGDSVSTFLPVRPNVPLHSWDIQHAPLALGSISAPYFNSTPVGVPESLQRAITARWSTSFGSDLTSVLVNRRHDSLRRDLEISGRLTQRLMRMADFVREIRYSGFDGRNDSRIRNWMTPAPDLLLRDSPERCMG